MLIYLIYLPLNLIASVLCYATNPFVLLTCNENGDLPFPLSLWGTWDNSCNPSDLLNLLPNWMTTWYEGHYEETKEFMPNERRYRWRTVCINQNFTIKERVLRYLCRLYWLTRNCGYGWAFYVFGVPCVGRELRVTHKTDKSIFATNGFAFIYKDDCKWFSVFGYDVYKCFFAGWKIDLETPITQQNMIASRIAIRFRKQA